MHSLKTGHSRLRRAGLGAALAVAAVASAAPMTANAAIIYSSTVYPTPSPGKASMPTAIDIGGVHAFDLNSDGTISGFTSGFEFVDVPTMSPGAGKGTPTPMPTSVIADLAVGTVVDSSSPFSTMAPGMFTGKGGAFGMGTGYFGFEFNPTGKQVEYGYGQVSLTGTGPMATETIGPIAFDNSGAGISVGAVPVTPVVPAPEPASLALLGSALAAAGYVRRKRRKNG